MKWLKASRVFGLLLLLTLMIVPALAQEDDGVPSILVEDLPTEPAVEWVETLYRRIEADRVSAPGASRIYGYSGVTLYQSLIWGMPDNLSLEGQIYHLPDLPFPEVDTVYDWLSVMNGAMSTVLPGLFLNPSEDTVKAFADLRAKQIEERTAEVGKEVVTHSIAYGDTLGMAILDWVADDNFVASREDTAAYQLPVGDGLYTLTGDFTAAAEPYWGSIRTFVLDGGYECNEPFNLEYSTDSNSTFYKQAQEVYETSRNLTPEQQETARFWVDTPGVSGTPAGHWVSIANQMVEQQSMTLDRMAMMHAMLGMGLADSFISCWYLKYQKLIIRPVTFIQDNIRRSWQPYIQTPPFPEYPSGHSVVSAAASEILTDFFGTVAFKDETHLIYGHEPLVRSYTSFEAAATEAAISRLYGGIHYRAAIENGMKQGRCVGQHVTSWITLNPVLQGGE